MRVRKRRRSGRKIRRMRRPGEAEEEAMKMASRSDSKENVAQRRNVAKTGSLSILREKTTEEMVCKPFVYRVLETENRQDNKMSFRSMWSCRYVRPFPMW